MKISKVYATVINSSDSTDAAAVASFRTTPSTGKPELTLFPPVFLLSHTHTEGGGFGLFFFYFC